MKQITEHLQAQLIEFIASALRYVHSDGHHSETLHKQGTRLANALSCELQAIPDVGGEADVNKLFEQYRKRPDVVLWMKESCKHARRIFVDGFHAAVPTQSAQQIPAQPECEHEAPEYCENYRCSGDCGNAHSHKEWLELAGLAPQPPQADAARDAATKEAIKLAYGHLWHINNEPTAPIPLYEPEKAAYQARKALRDLLTHEERGEAINAVRAAMSAAQGETQ